MLLDQGLNVAASGSLYAIVRDRIADRVPADHTDTALRISLHMVAELPVRTCFTHSIIAGIADQGVQSSDGSAATSSRTILGRQQDPAHGVSSGWKNRNERGRRSA